MSQWTMSWWLKAYFALLNVLITIFVRGKPIPTDPISELNLDPSLPILYVLPYNSKIDLLVVRSLCKKFNLPDPLKENNIEGQRLPSYIFIDKGPGIFASPKQKQRSIDILGEYLTLQQKFPSLNIQMLPTCVMFSRAPDKEGKKKPTLQVLSGTRKFFKVLFSGRDCFARFSHIVALKNITPSEDDIQTLAHKLSRVARIHFAKQHIAAIGPKLPNRQAMFNRLLHSAALTEAVNEEAKGKNISIEKAQKNALSMLNEIAANFTYRALRITNFVLTWAWSRLYQGLKVRNADPVRELAQNGHEIVYAPCHRSHMDYLLLSYVLYRQGLVPPHIAAGINLNFWPAGPIFRRLGAFFIRRSFRGNKLYTAVFREYLSELFIRGYSVEYFIEGGRSRTGRLLDPKTGMLMMTIQTMLRGDPRPITIVPVYIGYEHVLEVATYANELRGAAKKKESLWQTIKAFLRLKKLGFGYVNFGQPIPLNQFLTQHVPEWRDSIDPIEPQRPSWLTPTTNHLSQELMQEINKAAAVNPMNLCCSILLASHHRALTKNLLVEQLAHSLELLRNVRYSELVTIPSKNAEEILDHARNMGKFIITTDDAGEIISLSQEQAVLMTYYRNNIQHLLIIPALIARCVSNYKTMSRAQLIEHIQQLYPLIKAELFIYHSQEALINYINAIIDEFARLGLIIDQDNHLSVSATKSVFLQLFAANADETLQRYAIALSLLHKDPSISRGTLEKESRLIAERLSVLYGINAPEFFDKGVFATLVSTLREQGYLDDKDEAINDKIQSMCNILNPLIAPDIIQTIQEIK